MKNLEKIILGTVQFGLNYGINNSSGQVAQKEVFQILNTAYYNGIHILDTADAYGDATSIIGAYHDLNEHQFDIVTKFKTGYSNLKDLNGQINKSLEQLKVNSLFGYLYHSYADFKEHPKTLRELLQLKTKGKIKHLGVSLYTNEELEEVLSFEEIELIQLPYNLLDNESKRGEIIALAKEKGKIIHTRSVFLQGLFFKDINSIPEKLAPLRTHLSHIKSIADHKKEKIASLSLNYALSNQNIDGVLIGVDSLAQLEQNIYEAQKGLSQAKQKALNNIQVADDSLLNPSNW